MKKFFFLAAALATVATACTNLDEVNSRLDSLEDDVEQLSGDLATLKNAVNSNVYVTAVLSLTGSSVPTYSIEFSDGQSVTIKDGKDGEKGEDGDAFFKSVVVEGNTVVITLIDNTVIKLPVYTIDFSSVSFVPNYTTKAIYVDYFEPSEATFKAEYLIYPSSAADSLLSGVANGAYMVSVRTDEVQTRALSDKVDTLDAKSLSVSGSVLTVSFADSTFKYNGKKDVALLITNTVSGETICSDFVPVKYHCTALNYDGVTYRTVLMKDGRWWMAENLRYIPNVPGTTKKMVPSLSVSDSLGINNGVWYPVDMTTKKLTDNEDAIKSQGYLYNAETAFGVAVGTINETNYDSFEGCRGICPKGWHIPTGAEIFALTGRVNNWPDSPTATDPTTNGSPYFTVTGTPPGNCLIASLNADGFNLTNVGFINCTGKVDAKGAAINKGTISNMMAYFLGSSAYTLNMGYKSTSMFYNDTFKNAQYFCIMYNNTNKSSDGAASNYRNGCAVRCIKNQD